MKWWHDEKSQHLPTSPPPLPQPNSATGNTQSPSETIHQNLSPPNWPEFPGLFHITLTWARPRPSDNRGEFADYGLIQAAACHLSVGAPTNHQESALKWLYRQELRESTGSRAIVSSSSLIPDPNLKRQIAIPITEFDIWFFRLSSSRSPLISGHKFPSKRYLPL